MFVPSRFKLNFGEDGYYKPVMRESVTQYQKWWWHVRY